MGLVTWLIVGIIIVIFAFGIRIVRPTSRGLVERLGKYRKFASPGFHWIIPIIDQMYQVNITEQMVDARKQETITGDNLNASVDAQVYFKVKPEEDQVKNSMYKVNDVELQIVQLARTTLRNIMGTLTLKEANSERGKINIALEKTLVKETSNWGIIIVRTELKEIEPPADVQETMNKVVKAENEKEAAIDYATAKETEADGDKRAAIRIAEGRAQAVKLEANAKAEAIRVVNIATEETFKGKAQILRKLEATEKALQHNAKVVLPEGKSLINVLGSLSDVEKK